MTTEPWNRMVKTFRDSNTLLLWDYRGVGNSPPLKPKWNNLREPLKQHCLDLKTLLDHLGIDGGILCGHSMGVQTILEFYQHFPELVRGLICICGYYRNPIPEMKFGWVLGKAFNFFISGVDYLYPHLMPAWKLLSDTRVPRIIARTIGTNPCLSSDEDVEGYLRAFQRAKPEIFSYTAKELVRHDASSILDKIKVPVLIVAGEKDSWVPLEKSKDLAGRIKSAELFIIPNGSHTAFLDMPELVKIRIEKFLIEHFQKPQIGWNGLS
jgi:pimeloyl-ACP methyl ester carboxylesterase